MDAPSPLRAHTKEAHKFVVALLGIIGFTMRELQHITYITFKII